MSAPNPSSDAGAFTRRKAPLDEELVIRLQRAAGLVRTRRESAGTHQVYVALLEGVRGGPAYSFYVGITGLTPEERYLNHKAGTKSGRGWVLKYGIGFLPQLVNRLNPMSFSDAELIEKELLWRLCEAGFDVHGA